MPAVGLRRRKIEMLLEDLDQVPTLPGLACHVLSVVTNDRPNRRDLQMAVEVDPALAAKALKLAIDLGHPADDLTSIDRVFEAVPLEVLAAEMLNTQAVQRDLLDQVHLRALWRHTLAVAMAAQVTATRLGTVSPETALMAGLLHDLGQIAMRLLMPRAYAQVLERVEAGGGDLLEAERDLLGVDHAILGKRLAQRWGFAEVFQNVIWLHHQAQVPEGSRPGVGTLAQVVRLADLLARQHGFGTYASEQVAENPAEVAETLGLSGVQAEHIGRQIARAIELITGPVGFDADPTSEQMRTVYVSANARLGRLHRDRQRATRRAQAEAAHAHHLIALSADLAAVARPREVMERIAAAAAGSLGCRVVVPYLLAREGGYVEGVRYTPDAGVEDHFLYDLGSFVNLEPTSETLRSDRPVRAEQMENWLFERQGPTLGPGPFYTVAMTVGEQRVGGIVFARPDADEPLGPEASDHAADLAGIAGTALKRAQAEADLVALSEELADANRRLESAHRASLQQENVASLSEMATGAAHEINNPLAVISGRLQQFAADEQDPGRRKTFDTLIQQAHRISDILAELKTFARPPLPRPTLVDPVALAHATAEAEAPAAEAAGVRVAAEGPDDAPAICVDRDQVAAALAEVVRNGVQACSQAGGGNVAVRVEVLPSRAAARFVVTDDGPGMAPEIRSRAFDPFYSGYEAGRRRGLGLPKAYRAVQANGGQMALESSPGRGTRVRITFPAAEGQVPADDASASDEPSSDAPENEPS